MEEGWKKRNREKTKPEHSLMEEISERTGEHWETVQ